MDADHGGGVDEAEAAFFARRGSRCCCFPCWPSSTSSSSSALSHQRVGGAAATLGGEEEHWWQGAVDALSYALNFDEGHGATPEAGDHAGGYRDFSSRFAAPPASAKSSMDLGGRDAPPLFHPPPADGAPRA
ncbi:unnamed protein product [Triticum turgidum subsp. durum]|uniref:Uncharacterized protein n=1 Tax=Triticum turgidum subsp. durum TaxID=4567 RepID=A0A9R1BDN8_TRITD|nr:unnamed protein product [Triticum turgidum subsp. durum]